MSTAERAKIKMFWKVCVKSRTGVSKLGNRPNLPALVFINKVSTQIPWTARKMNKWFLEQIKSEILLEAKMTKQVVLLQAYNEKAGFFGKDNNIGKNRRQQEKKKTKYEMD